MTTDAPTTPTRETWRDWSGGAEPPADELLTRSEFLDRLRQRGVDVTESTLLHWERAGALPRPVRRWRGRTPATWYPEWLVPLAARIPGLQADGLELREIGPRLRHVVSSDTAQVRVTEETTVVKYPPGATTAAGKDDIAPALLALARRYERITGSRVVRVEARIIDEEGRPLVFRFDTRPPPDE